MNQYEMIGTVLGIVIFGSILVAAMLTARAESHAH